MIFPGRGAIEGTLSAPFSSSDERPRFFRRLLYDFLDAKLRKDVENIKNLYFLAAYILA
jgi:hypothetical protein